MFHFLGDYALAGVVHLGKIAIAVGGLTLRNPLRAWFEDRMPVTITVRAVI
jgi:hypothetical protein